MLDEASKQRVKSLCDQIAKEEDRDGFSKLISELNELLESADARTADRKSSFNFDGGRSDGHQVGNTDGKSDGKAHGSSAGRTDGITAGTTDAGKDVTPPGNRPS